MANIEGGESMREIRLREERDLEEKELQKLMAPYAEIDSETLLSMSNEVQREIDELRKKEDKEIAEIRGKYGPTIKSKTDQEKGMTRTLSRRKDKETRENKE